jgi:hypothetical protein
MLVKVDKEDFVIEVIPDMPKVETQICKGPWHRRGGVGTSLPITSFPFNRYKPGERTKTCQTCIEGRHGVVPEKVQLEKLDMERAERMKDIENGMVPVSQGGAMHKWRVTALQPIEVVVYAKDYFEIGSEVTGEILKVERLD